jgi:hypothetical protein
LRKTLLNTKSTNSFERVKPRRVERVKKRRNAGRGANTRCRPFHVSAFRELVALLWAAGKPEEAVRV